VNTAAHFVANLEFLQPTGASETFPPSLHLNRCVSLAVRAAETEKRPTGPSSKGFE
jgi:hypothetical protein